MTGVSARVIVCGSLDPAWLALCSSSVDNMQLSTCKAALGGDSWRGFVCGSRVALAGLIGITVRLRLGISSLHRLISGA